MGLMFIAGAKMLFDVIGAVNLAVLSAKVIEIKRINVSDEQFYRNTEHRDLYLVTFKKRGNVGRLAVLSFKEPTLADAALIAIKMTNSFNLDGLKLALGTKYNKIVEAVNDGSAPVYVQRQERDRDAYMEI